MKVTKPLYILAALLFFTSIGVKAQVDILKPNPVDTTYVDERKGAIETEAEEVVADSLTAKTLDTYMFGDWHKPVYVFSWQHNPFFNTVDKRLAVDTTINNNVFDYPFFKNDVGATFLGNSGSAALTHDYFKRQSPKGLLFFTPYSDYMYTRENIPSYNTKGPFSMLTYVTSGKKQISEDNLKVLLTQNVTPEWNLGLYYQRYGSRGVYKNQGTDNRVFTFYTSYAGKRYSAHAGYIHNRVSNEENGGIVKDDDIINPEEDPEILDVNLASAGNRLRSNGYFLTHSYGLPLHIFNRNDSLKTGEGTMVYFGHAFQYLRQYRIYTDKITDETYYQDFFISPTESRDSSFTSSLDNRLFIRLQPWSPTAIVSTIDGGVGLDYSKYHSFSPNQFLYGTTDDTYTDLYMYARVSSVFSKYFAWNAFGQYVISGYKQSDFLIDASARISVYPFSRQLNLEGRLVLENTEPDYFLKRYYSNHFKWDESFSKTTNTRIEVALSIPDYKLEVGLKQSIVSNLVYMDKSVAIIKPKQEGDAISITSLYVQKNFKAGAFHADNRLLFQFSGNEDIVPLPKISLNARWYAQFQLVKSVLMAQVGFDAYFHTKYYVPAYNPAVGLFHNQKEKKIGDYPMVDAFLNFKWKRVTLYAKFSHVDQGMFNNEYFSALHYPRNKRMVRFGLTWHFYN